jgi:hypothetical protein
MLKSKVMNYVFIDKLNSHSKTMSNDFENENKNPQVYQFSTDGCIPSTK